MGFYEILEEQGLSDLLQRVPYEQPNFQNWLDVRRAFGDIVDNQRSVFIIGDYDVDGLMCNLIISEGLRRLGVKNYDIFQYHKRTHLLDPRGVQQCIQGHYDYCIISDCGSHDISLLRKLLSYGVKVILLDHHRTMTSYERYSELGDISVINTTLESPRLYLSAGALCYCVMHQILADYSIDEGGLSVYAAISLFADCMDMRDKLNRSIYYVATTAEIPGNIQMFMNKYHKLNARFINFWYAPRINAMFRSENLAVLNKLYLTSGALASDLAACLDEINTQYEVLRDMVTCVADLIEVEELDTFVIGNLNTVNSHYDIKKYSLWNYTGLIANKLSDRYSKTGFVFCNNGNFMKGSVRDLYGRDYLTTFTQLCAAEGHSSAFGTRIQLLEFEEFMQSLRRVDKKFAITTVPNKPIILDYPYMNPDSALIEDMANVNEFSGASVPQFLLRKQRIGDLRERKTDYGFQYRWGDYIIQSKYAIGFGRQMLLRPYKSYSTKLQVQ